MRSVHVLTGTDRAKQLIAADASSRPDFILDDLRQLFEPYPEPITKADVTTVAGARIRVSDGRVQILADGDRAIDLLRAACAAIWRSGLPIYALDVPPRLYR